MHVINFKKMCLVRLCSAFGLNYVLKHAQQWFFGQHIRVVNYHNFNLSMLDGFEEQLKWFQKNYINADRLAFNALLEGTWKSDRPGLAITFDDGLRSQFEYALPLLEKYGFTGWFFVPVQFIDTEASAQISFAEAHRISMCEQEFKDGRRAMTWDELRQIAAQGHEIGSHTLNHIRLGSDIGDSELEREIYQSRLRLEEELGRIIDIFCWVGGEESSYSRMAAKIIREAGYRMSFMTNNLPLQPRENPLQIQRTNIEAWFPLNLVKFQLNGILDLIYLPKRRRVNLLTA